MSEAQKPVEVQPLAEAAPTNPEAVVEPTAAAGDEIAPTEPAAETKAEEKKEEAKEPPKPITEGTMGYKAPGLVKSFRFSKKFFWFGEDAVETKDLHIYLRGEKPEVAHAAAAWSSQTGKGLLYFAKTAEGKAQPVGIIQLSEISDITPDSFTQFHFKLHGQKHSFETSTRAERDSWVETMKTKAAEAKDAAEGITGSDGYKETHEKLGKSGLAVPAVVPSGSSPKKSTDKAPERVKKDNASSSDEESKKKKVSRSVSRKRGSIFGALLGKKEEHEEKKEEKKEEKDEDKAAKSEEAAPEAATTAVVAEPTPVAEPAKADEPAPATEETAKPAEPATEAKETPAKPSKRNSIFGDFFQKVKKEVSSPSEEKKKEEVAPAVPAKDTETPAAPVAEPIAVPAAKSTETEEAPAATTAPVVSSSPKKDKVENFFGKLLKPKEHKPVEKKEEAVPKIEEPAAETAPVAETTEAPAAPTETTEPAATETSTPVVEAPPATKERRRSSFFSGLGKKSEKKSGDVTSDSETEPKEKSTPTSPLPKLGDLFRKPSKAKAQKDAKKEATPPATVEETAEPAATTETAPAATSTTPADAPVTNGAIGDVTPDAITVGQAPHPVHAAA